MKLSKAQKRVLVKLACRMGLMALDGRTVLALEKRGLVKQVKGRRTVLTAAGEAAVAPLVPSELQDLGPWFTCESCGRENDPDAGRTYSTCCGGCYRTLPIVRAELELL